MSENVETIERLRQAQSSNPEMVGEIMEEHRDRLRRMIRLRMDRRLQGRVDASDILQEAYIEASERLAEYLDNPKMPFGLWLRFIAGQKTMQMARRHLGVQARDVNREISIYQGAVPQVASAVLAARLIGQVTSPSMKIMKAEMKIRLQETLDEMDEIDREIIALRHFEQLSLKEAGQILEISHSAACNRYVRALERLKDLIGEFPLK